MKAATMGGISAVIIVVYYLAWRVSMFREIFKRSGQILRNRRRTKA
jgi:hypothetical protein